MLVKMQVDTDTHDPMELAMMFEEKVSERIQKRLKRKYSSEIGYATITDSLFRMIESPEDKPDLEVFVDGVFIKVHFHQKSSRLFANAIIPTEKVIQEYALIEEISPADIEGYLLRMTILDNEDVRSKMMLNLLPVKRMNVNTTFILEDPKCLNPEQIERLSQGLYDDVFQMVLIPELLRQKEEDAVITLLVDDLDEDDFFRYQINPED